MKTPNLSKKARFFDGGEAAGFNVEDLNTDAGCLLLLYSSSALWCPFHIFVRERLGEKIRFAAGGRVRRAA